MNMIFRNRENAAEQLADRLRAYAGAHPLILAIPRGAVPISRIIADRLGGELDVILVRKLGAPGNPEYAVGSVDENGNVTLNPDTAGTIDDAYLEREARAQMETIRMRRKLYTPIRPPLDPKDQIVIVVDDGVATGSTVIAALRAIRAKKPKKLIVAIGVAPRDALERLVGEADDVVCLQTPAGFMTVGQFFGDFRQVSDEEVVGLLDGRSRNARGTSHQT